MNLLIMAFVSLASAIAAAGAPSTAQAVAGLDFSAVVTELVLPYVASALSVASIMEVWRRWIAPWLGRLRWFAWLPPLFLKAPGQTKLTRTQRAVVRALVLVLALAAALTGSVTPLGGESAGVFGRIGAACLVALLAMGLRDSLRAAVRRSKVAGETEA